MGVEGDGFAEFIDARQHALQRTAWWLTGEWALAEDLVQAALVRSWPRWERIGDADRDHRQQARKADPRWPGSVLDRDHTLTRRIGQRPPNRHA